MIVGSLRARAALGLWAGESRSAGPPRGARVGPKAQRGGAAAGRHATSGPARRQRVLPTLGASAGRQGRQDRAVRGAWSMTTTFSAKSTWESSAVVARKWKSAEGNLEAIKRRDARQAIESNERGGADPCPSCTG